jgi:hypothetical protein
MAPRPTPYDLAFADIAEERFTGIRAALQGRGQDPLDRDAFLMLREVVTFIRDLRPEAGIGEGIDQLAALVHHAYLFWDAGTPVAAVSPDRLDELLADAAPIPAQGGHRGAPPRYTQFPEFRVWATVVPGEPAEPLDGCFTHGVDRDLRVLGVFGVRPERMGFSVVEAAGERPTDLARPNGTALFAPELPGGTAAGLHSLVGAEELLELGWRAQWQ